MSMDPKIRSHLRLQPTRRSAFCTAPSAPLSLDADSVLSEIRRRNHKNRSHRSLLAASLSLSGLSCPQNKECLSVAYFCLPSQAMLSAPVVLHTLRLACTCLVPGGSPQGFRHTLPPSSCLLRALHPCASANTPPSGSPHLHCASMILLNYPLRSKGNIRSSE